VSANARSGAPGRALRILFTAQPASGHLRPLIPVAHAAQRRGHDVRMATHDQMADEVASYGLPHLTAGYNLGPDMFSVLPRGFFRLSYADAADILRDASADVTAIYASRAAQQCAAALLEHARNWLPDLVVREADEFGGYLAAEALGVPHVSVASFGGLTEITGPRIGPLLDKGRAELGLPGDPQGERLYSYLHATFVPRAYAEAEFILPNTRAYQHPLMGTASEVLPTWITELDHAKPFVFAAFGTVVYDIPGAHAFVAEVISALGSLPVTAVLAVGRGKDAGAFGAVPPNVALVDFADQRLMLEACDLFLTHGGLGSVKDALRLGVPMVGIGPGLDHRHNVEMLRRAGVGVAVDVHEARAGTIADACREVLGNPAYAARARTIQRHMQALPPVDQLVRDCEQLPEGNA
jgi:UDP:flavonoid glycosyltransferase YjiC (YdhE family)